MKKMKLPGFGRKTTLNIDFALIFQDTGNPWLCYLNHKSAVNNYFLSAVNDYFSDGILNRVMIE